MYQIIKTRPHGEKCHDYDKNQGKYASGRKSDRFEQDYNYGNELCDRFYLAKHICGDDNTGIVRKDKAHRRYCKLAEDDKQRCPKYYMPEYAGRNYAVCAEIKDIIGKADRNECAEYHEFIGKRIHEFPECRHKSAFSGDVSIKEIGDRGDYEYSGGNDT